MMRKLVTPFFLLVVFAVAACNMPAPTASAPSLEEQAGTLVAQTLTAAIQSTQPQPTETHIPAKTPTPPLPTITAAPTLSPTPTVPASLPNAPGLQKYDFFCTWNGSNNDLNITIHWDDKASDEQGYKIYRNGKEIADLTANSAVYSDVYAVDRAVAVRYAIEAYNQNGASTQLTISAACE